MRKVSYILFIVFITALGLPARSYAIINFVIPDGTTETTTQTLDDDGDGLLIEEGGAIVTTDIAVSMDAENQTVLNRGNISTTGVDAVGINNEGAAAEITNSGLILTTGEEDAVGINNEGAAAEITNSGLISTTGVDAVGINNEGAAAEITNSGLISTTGESAVGIFNEGAAAEITNSGLISTTGLATFGIFNVGAGAEITNSGLISTQGLFFAVGIFNDGAGAEITNSGLISTTGLSARGISNEGGSNVVITNSGLISTQGEEAVGIFNEGANVHIINSGTIRSEQSFALHLSGGATPTVSLLRGSNLQGRVLVNDDDVNLNVETGLNLALTLDSTSSAGYGKLGIEAPFIILVEDKTIGVIDPTGLSMQADVVADLSDTILGGIYRHKKCGCGVWVQGIGSYRKRSYTVGYDNWQGGFLVGYNAGSIGLFGGISFGEAEVDQRTQKAETTSYVAGLSYERVFCNTFLGLAIAVGYVDWDNERFVMNNLVPGGVEKARADMGGMFISPEVTLSHRFASFWLRPSMSFTLRYAGLFLGSYKEKGSLTDLSVKEREIDLLTTRFELSVPCFSGVEPYVGVSGRYQVGGYRVNAELLGKSLSFNQGGPRNLVALLLGVRAVRSLGCFDIFLNLEASFDNDSSSRILGEGGVGFRF